MNQVENWYIIKQENGQCSILPESQLSAGEGTADDSNRWGPYPSQQEAIARRVGLIRAGKCKPV